MTVSWHKNHCHLAVYSTTRSTQQQRKYPRFALPILPEGNPLVTSGFRSQRASDAGSVSMSWRFQRERDLQLLTLCVGKPLVMMIWGPSCPLWRHCNGGNRSHFWKHSHSQHCFGFWWLHQANLPALATTSRSRQQIPLASCRAMAETARTEQTDIEWHDLFNASNAAKYLEISANTLNDLIWRTKCD